MKRKLIHGIGINDADYIVNPTINGKRVNCPFYETWRGMLTRCYFAKYQERRTTYIGCSVVNEWLTFSNFKKWMETQDWEGKQIDKDILFKGNKIYSPDTCVFVSCALNLFLTDRANDRGAWPIGVCWHKREHKFRSKCSNPFTGENKNLGSFTAPQDAHLTWKKYKHELALQYADMQTDDRIAKALRVAFI